jgi:hypothetical protein
MLLNLISRLATFILRSNYHQHHWQALYEHTNPRHGPTAFWCSHPGCGMTHHIEVVPPAGEAVLV